MEKVKYVIESHRDSQNRRQYCKLGGGETIYIAEAKTFNSLASARVFIYTKYPAGTHVVPQQFHIKGE